MFGQMDIREYKYVVVGSGLLGAVVSEQLAKQLNEPVLVLEKRNHIGGNCYSSTDDATGIEYHRYGTHVFHTDNAMVWDYINRFTSFNNYRHQVLSCYRDKLYQLPVNLETINSFYGVNLRPYEVDGFLDRFRPKIEEPANFEEKAISLLGPDLYNAFIKTYTEKQWQMDPRLLPASVFTRLPFRKNYEENYYHDRWQGIPLHGYTKMFENILASDKIHIRLNTDFFALRGQLHPDAMIIYSGPIDQFFDYKYGRLSWRTLDFESEIKEVNDFQGTAVINYPEKTIPYIRVHEPKHLHPEREHLPGKTLVIREYSKADDGSQPYYPILSSDNLKLHQQYREEAARQQNLFIAGRLGDYKYYDMHQTIAIALQMANTIVSSKRAPNARTL